MPNLYHQWKAR